jgi:hypothetical protein
MRLINEIILKFKYKLLICFFTLSFINNLQAQPLKFQIEDLDGPTRKTYARKVANLYEKLVGIPLRNSETPLLKEKLIEILYFADDEKEGLKKKVKNTNVICSLG